MTFNISCIKSSIIKHNFKRYWWISALYTIIMLLSVPFVIMMDRSYERLLEMVTKYPERMGEVITQNGASYFFIAFVPVLVAVCVFRYMQHNRSATLFHSLPFTRKQLYFSNTVSGWLIFIIPLIITALVLIFMSMFTIYGKIFTVIHVLQWLGRLVLLGTVAYSLTILVGMFTGNSFAQFLFVYILNGLPFVLTALSYVILDSWLYGFAADGITFALNAILKYSPYYLMVYGFEVSLFHVILNVIYTILALIIGLFAYERRNVEKSGDIITFQWFSHVFLYGVTTCAMLVGVAFIKSVQNSNPNIVVYLLFAVLGYAIAKMLLVKSFRIVKYYKGVLVFFGVTILCFTMINYDISGFGTRMPNENDVEKVYVGNHIPSNIFEEDFLTKYGSVNGVLLRKPENMKSVIELQKSAIEERILAQQAQNDLLDQYRKYYFVYQYKDGKKFIRTYYLKKNAVYPVFESDEAKDFTHSYIRVNRDSIDYVQVNVWKENRDKNIHLVDEKKEQFLDALNKDIDELSYQDRVDAYSTKTGAFASIEFFVKKDNDNRQIYYLEISSKFTNALKWLAENGYQIS